MTPKMFAEGLSLLCKIGDGLAHAFVRLDVTNRYASHYLNLPVAILTIIRLQLSAI